MIEQIDKVIITLWCSALSRIRFLLLLSRIIELCEITDRLFARNIIVKVAIEALEFHSIQFLFIFSCITLLFLFHGLEIWVPVKLTTLVVLADITLPRLFPSLELVIIVLNLRFLRIWLRIILISIHIIIIILICLIIIGTVAMVLTTIITSSIILILIISILIIILIILSIIVVVILSIVILLIIIILVIVLIIVVLVIIALILLLRVLIVVLLILIIVILILVLIVILLLLIIGLIVVAWWWWLNLLLLLLLLNWLLNLLLRLGLTLKIFGWWIRHICCLLLHFMSHEFGAIRFRKSYSFHFLHKTILLWGIVRHDEWANWPCITLWNLCMLIYFLLSQHLVWINWANGREMSKALRIKTALNLDPLGNNWIEHIVPRLNQLIHHFITNHVLKIELPLTFVPFHFACCLIQFLLHMIPRIQFYFRNIILVEPLLEIKLECLKRHLRISKNILLLLMAVSNGHCVFKLCMILLQHSAVLFFLRDVYFQ